VAPCDASRPLTNRHVARGLIPCDVRSRIRRGPGGSAGQSAAGVRHGRRSPHLAKLDPAARREGGALDRSHPWAYSSPAPTPRSARRFVGDRDGQGRSSRRRTESAVMKPIAAGADPTPEGLRNADALELIAAAKRARFVPDGESLLPPIARFTAHRGEQKKASASKLAPIVQAFGPAHPRLRTWSSSKPPAGLARAHQRGRKQWPTSLPRSTCPFILVVGLRLGCLSHRAAHGPRPSRRAGPHLRGLGPAITWHAPLRLRGGKHRHARSSSHGAAARGRALFQAPEKRGPAAAVPDRGSARHNKRGLAPVVFRPAPGRTIAPLFAKRVLFPGVASSLQERIEIVPKLLPEHARGRSFSSARCAWPPSASPAS